MDSDVLISIKDLWVRYNHRIVLEGIHLTVHSKEIFSIVGPNGGGKTTLLDTILGFIEPYRGEVRVFGEKPQSIQKSGLIGYLPQKNDYDRFFPVNVFDVVAMSRYTLKGSWRRLNSEDKNQVFHALSIVEMIDFKDHHFGSLSRGQQQRVLIARALAIQPRILILDEPSTGLDAVAQDTFYHTLHEIRDSKDITILMVSHDIGTVSSVVDQIACLNRKLHFHGNPNQGIPSDALEKVFGRDIRFLIHDEHCRTCEK